MTLRDEDFGRIGEYVKPWLRELVDETVHRMNTRFEDTSARIKTLTWMIGVGVRRRCLADDPVRPALLS